MAEQQIDHTTSFMAKKEQPLIGLLLQEEGKEIVHYFSDEEDADAATSAQRMKEILGLAGAWKDLDWDEMERGLHRIRHESRPTPPISL